MNDISGTTTYTYDAFGDEAQIATFGLYSKTLVRQQDAFGRDLGHTMDGSRKNVIEYDAATGRIRREQLGGAWYTWEYLPGSDLKSSLSVGTAGRATWVYEPNRDLLTQVKNEAFGSIISQYDYTNDALGRRTAIARSGTMMSESRSDAYGYNTRSELISAAKNGINEYAYQYDDIGNRESSVEPDNSFAYTANELNQYDAITSQTSLSSVALAEEDQTFIPQYDLDGNQILVKTKTGIWSVTYNGENRPISWYCGTTNIVMKFDRMGRRVEYIETVVDPIGSTVVTNKHQKLVYDGYLCVQRLNGSDNSITDLFEWDPTEPVATRPLFWQARTSEGNYSLFYTHDGNKNVSEAVFYQRARGVAAHYEYAPFGEVTATSRSTPVTACDFCEYNPFRFSSEYEDDVLCLVYYNFRHYEPCVGRWLSRDPIEETGGLLLYSMCNNSPLNLFDELGSSFCSWCECIGLCVTYNISQFWKIILAMDSAIASLDAAMEIPVGAKAFNLGTEEITSLGNKIYQLAQSGQNQLVKKMLQPLASWARTSGSMSWLPGLRSSSSSVRRMAKGLRNALRAARGLCTAALASAAYIEGYCASSCLYEDEQNRYKDLMDNQPEEFLFGSANE